MAHAGAWAGRGENQGAGLAAVDLRTDDLGFCFGPDYGRMMGGRMIGFWMGRGGDGRCLFCRGQASGGYDFVRHYSVKNGLGGLWDWAWLAQLILAE